MNRALSSLAFLCLTLTSSLAATDILYVQAGKTITTYSVNKTTAASQKLGTLTTNSAAASPITVARSGSFLYVLGWVSGMEYFNVYALSSAGIPAAKPIQTFNVKAALTQFFIHPDGAFAYAMYSWIETVRGSLGWVADIVLFTINPKTGIMTNTKQVVTNYPLGYYSQTYLYGFNATGNVFYIRAYSDFSNNNGNSFYSYAVNSTTGALKTL